MFVVVSGDVFVIVFGVAFVDIVAGGRQVFGTAAQWQLLVQLVVVGQVLVGGGGGVGGSVVVVVVVVIIRGVCVGAA